MRSFLSKVIRKIVHVIGPFVSNIDSPLVRRQKGGRSVHVAGWVFFKDGSATETVRVIGGKRIRNTLKHLLPRPDVQKRYPQYSAAGNSGFVGDVFVPAGLMASLRLVAQDARGKWHSLERFPIQLPTLTELFLENGLGARAYHWLMDRTVPQPILVAGMHRSGTRLVCQMLGKLGVQMGAYPDPNFESFYFQNIHMRLLEQKGEDWRNFGGTLAGLNDPIKLGEVVNGVKTEIENHLLANHFGMRRFRDFLMAARNRNNILWGWKDPRATLFLPLWKQLYPGMKVVLVVRHPKDVCLSLYRRDGIPLPECFDLWKEYNRLGYDFFEQYPGQTLLVHYEKLHEKAVLRQLTSFIGTPADCEAVSSIIKYSERSPEEVPGMKELNKRISEDYLSRMMGYGVAETGCL